MGQGRDVRRLRPVALRRRASVRGILHRILQRGPALGGARLPNAQGVQGTARSWQGSSQKAQQNQVREEASQD